MGKARKKEKSFGAKIKAGSGITKKENPFDMIFKKANKNKVLGDNKQNANLTKRTAFDIRKRTIGVEYMNQGKTNKIIDRRIAEKDPNLSAVEKAELRFVMQRKKLFAPKKNKFNLNDDGKEEDAQADDDDGFFPNDKKINLRKKVEKDDEGGEMGTDLVALANFGGGKFDDEKRSANLMTSKHMSRNDVLSSIISMSKQAKALRQMERDALADDTDRLNEIFTKLKDSGALAVKTRRTGDDALSLPTESATVEQLPSTNSYDFLYQELQFNSARATKPNYPKADVVSEVCFEERGFNTLLDEFDTVSASDLCKVVELTDAIHKKVKNSPFACGIRFLEALKRRRAAVVEASTENGSVSSRGVDFRNVVFVQCVGRVYVTHGRYHPVCTPTLFHALELVAWSRVYDADDVGQVLVLCTVLREWVAETRRYLPEVVAFLRGALQLCVLSDESEPFPSLSFPVSVPHRQLLYVDRKTGARNLIDGLSIKQLFDGAGGTVVGRSRKVTDVQRRKLHVIRALIDIIRQYADLYKQQTVSYYAVFGPFLTLIDRLPVDNYPDELVKNIRNLKTFIIQQMDNAPALTQLKVPARSEIKPITMLEPKFEDHFNFKTAKISHGLKKPHRTMRQKANREKRGAMKELRLDARFIGRMQHEQAAQISRERREKTKRIMASLQNQESEYKKRKLKKF